MSDQVTPTSGSASGAGTVTLTGAGDLHDPSAVEADKEPITK